MIWKDGEQYGTTTRFDERTLLAAACLATITDDRVADQRVKSWLYIRFLDESPGMTEPAPYKVLPFGQEFGNYLLAPSKSLELVALFLSPAVPG